MVYTVTDHKMFLFNQYPPFKPLTYNNDNNIIFVSDIWNKSIMNCRNEMKMKKWSSQWTQFMQLRKEAWKKFRT